MNSTGNTLRNYISSFLDEQYEITAVFSETPTSSVTLYTQKNTGKKLVCITSTKRNDHIYRLLKSAKCHNLPQIYEVCSDDDSFFVLREYVEGQSLSSLMEQQSIKQQDAIKYISDICNALLVLHSEKIVHRDIKPSNIIIRPDNSAVLIDFSISRLITEGKDHDTDNLGTAGYAAPEQYGISQSSFVTDIFPLGVILNELILGVHPTIETPKGKVGKIISRCITTQMSKRYQSVNQIQKSLKHCR